MRALIVLSLAVVLVAPSARAQTIDSSLNGLATRSPHDPWHIDLPSCAGIQTATRPKALATRVTDFEQDAQPLHAAAVEHSQAYQTRTKIHKYASFATLPLFAAEVALGQSLYNTPANTGARRAAHGIVGAGIVGLFGVNTVTGAWNLFGEGWQEKDGRTLRLVHGLLMMVADAGFVATTMSGPNSRSPRQALTFESRKVTHRDLAIASISVGTAGYLVMLLGNH